MLPIVLESTDKPNLSQLRVGSLIVFYSYRDPIGFMISTKTTVSELDPKFSITTRKHINVLEPNNTVRIANAAFLVALDRAMRAACREVAKNPAPVTVRD